MEEKEHPLVYNYELVYKPNTATYEEIQKVTMNMIQNNIKINPNLLIWMFSHEELLNIFRLILAQPPPPFAPPEQHMQFNVISHAIHHLKTDPPTIANNNAFAILDISMCVKPNDKWASGMYMIADDEIWKK